MHIQGSEGTRRSRKHWIKSDYRRFLPEHPPKRPQWKAEILGPCSLQLQEIKKERCDFYTAIWFTDYPLGTVGINEFGCFIFLMSPSFCFSFFFF